MSSSLQKTVIAFLAMVYCLATGWSQTPTPTPTPTAACSDDTWTATSTTNAPARRQYGHTAVWTGNEMIVWGGADFGSPPTYFNTGGRYNPLTDTWTATRTIN